MVDKDHAGFFWNDTGHTFDPLNKGPGWRSWNPPAPSFAEARLAYNLLQGYKDLLAANRKSDDEITDATIEARKDPKALKTGTMEAKYEVILRGENMPAAEIIRKLEASRTFPAEMNQKLAAAGWTWPETVRGRAWWSNRVEGEIMVRKWEEVLKKQGKEPEEIVGLRMMSIDMPEMKRVLDGVGVMWPPNLTDMATYYRSADYIGLEGGISCGKPRPLPSKLPKIPKGDVLLFVQLHLFHSDQDIVDTYQQAVARATTIGDPEPTTVEEILKLYISAKKQAEREGTEFTTRAWAEEVFKNRSQTRDLPVMLAAHDPLPKRDGTEGGGGGIANPDPKPGDPGRHEPVEHPDRPDHHDRPGERSAH